jgi:effector-binding domain-containing protein
MEMEIKDVPEELVISIRTVTNMENMPGLIGKSYHKIMAYLEEVGEKITKVPYVAYYSIDPNNIDMESGFPITKEIPSKEDMIVKTIPASKCATYMYKGPYSKMVEAYNEMFKQIGECGLKPTGVYYEYYYNSPEEVPEEELLTYISIPVEKENSNN